MEFFNFFRKKTIVRERSEQEASEPIDENLYLLEALKDRLTSLGYQVERHPQYLGLIANSELEIATLIINNPENHVSILHLRILTIHAKYFSDGIDENIVGFGTTIQDKVNSVLNNYINTTFLPIIDSFSDSHNPVLDFTTIRSNKEVLWHPKLGSLNLQGQWKEHPQGEPFFEILKDKIKEKITSNKINWLKIYISKRSDGTIIGECKFNNEPWEDGLTEVIKYAESWNVNGDFYGLKQFIMFRRCDAFDK